MTRLASVAVPVPFLPLLTYRVPETLPLPAKGARVIVPLGTRRVAGCVVDHPVDPPGSNTSLKEIAGILDEEAFVPPQVIDLAMWIAEYYACGPGDAIGICMPPGARRGRESAFKTVRVASLTGLPHPARVSAKQRAVLDLLAGGAAALPDLKANRISAAVLSGLAARGLVSIESVPVERDPFGARWARDLALDSAEADARVLTDDQARAAARLAVLADASRFGVALLHGVTGSGKTEIYRRLARRVCDGHRTTLILVPEIALTPGIVVAFRAAFRDGVAVQHSGLSDGERHDQWHRIRRGDVKVVIGTRSAVTAPLERIGLIVVDEEHDPSYKQDESPRYHARDVAIVRGKREDALVVLGSATPSMESYLHATRGRYELITLERRVHDRPLADVRLVNMREEYARDGPEVILSGPLKSAMAERLDRGEQVLLLLNRRGFATRVFCRQCGGTLECPHCSVSLIVHQRIPKPGPPTRVSQPGVPAARTLRGGVEPVGVARARCHYCDFAQVVPKACSRCAAPYLQQTGFGTERVEAEVVAAFPEARTARLDRDSARRRGATAELLRRFAAREVDVLIGTQMIAKGHDFPRVTLVGVISADVGLGLPDFRAAERTFQLLTQVVGRAGRGDLAGEAIVQTVYPDHYGIRHACRQDYAAFFREEIAFRRAMRYPPVASLISAIVRGGTFQAALDAASDLVNRVRSRGSAVSKPLRVLGPAPAPLVRLRGEHRAQFFVKGDPDQRGVMREAVLAAVAERPDLKKRVTIDVDPLSML